MEQTRLDLIMEYGYSYIWNKLDSINIKDTSTVKVRFDSFDPTYQVLTTCQLE